MKDNPRVLIVIGSPKNRASTSGFLAGYIKRKLEIKKVKVELKCAYSLLGSSKGINELFRLLKIADHLMVISPLYVDSLPWGLTKSLEEILKNKSRLMLHKKSISAIINCGFPEPEHNLLALDICRCFAQKAGMRWIGAVMIGNGEEVRGRDTHLIKSPQGDVKKALDVIADCIRRNDVFQIKHLTHKMILNCNELVLLNGINIMVQQNDNFN